MTENAGEVEVATLTKLSDREEVTRFFAALSTLRSVGKAFGFKHTRRQVGSLAGPYVDVLGLTALKEDA